MSVVNINKHCDTCKINVSPTEWFMFCTHHLVREHIECASSSLSKSKHAKCKRIEKNYPADVFSKKKKRSREYKSHFKEIIIKGRLKNMEITDNELIRKLEDLTTFINTTQNY